MENPTIYLVKISADEWLGAEGPVNNKDIAQKFDSESDAQGKADLYNSEFGRDSEIAASVDYMEG